MIESTKHKNIFSKVYTENWSREIFIINLYTLILFLKLILGLKTKDLNGERIIGSFYEKELLRSKL